MRQWLCDRNGGRPNRQGLDSLLLLADDQLGHCLVGVYQSMWAEDMRRRELEWVVLKAEVVATPAEFPMDERSRRPVCLHPYNNVVNGKSAITIFI